MMKKVLVMIMSMMLCISPVYGAEMDVNHPCSLSLSLVDDHHRSLQKGTFTLYQAAYYKEGTLVNNAHMTSLKTATIKKAVHLLPQVSKDVHDGKVVFRDLKCGIYYVSETNTQENYYPVKSFLVTMPESDQDHHYNYDILAKPKVEETYNQNNTPSNEEDDVAQSDETTYKTKPKEKKDVTKYIHQEAKKVNTQDATRIISYVVMLGIALAAMIFIKRLK
jgi:hypothetical protein